MFCIMIIVVYVQWAAVLQTQITVIECAPLPQETDDQWGMSYKRVNTYNIDLFRTQLLSVGFLLSSHILDILPDILISLIKT